MQTGNYEEAGPFLEKALAMQEDVGDQGDIAQLLRDCGGLAFCMGSYETAEAHLKRSLELYEWFGDHIRTGALLRQLGHVARRQGDHERAADLLRRSISLRRERDSSNPMAVWSGGSLRGRV